MAISADYKAFIEELFAPAFQVRVRSMFGGAGIFFEEVMIGLISDERVYLKVDETTRPAFETEGMKPFVYGRDGKAMAMSYFAIPERLYDEPDELKAWALKARDVAFKGKTRAKKARRSIATKGKPKST